MNDFLALGQSEFSLVGTIVQSHGRDIVTVARLFHQRLNLVDGVKLRIVRRRNVRGVWPEKSHREEERLASFVRVMILHDPDGIERALAVGVVLVLSVDDAPRDGAAVLALDEC